MVLLGLGREWWFPLSEDFTAVLLPGREVSERGFVSEYVPSAVRKKPLWGSGWGLPGLSQHLSSSCPVSSGPPGPRASRKCQCCCFSCQPFPSGLWPLPALPQEGTERSLGAIT